MEVNAQLVGISVMLKRLSGSKAIYAIRSCSRRFWCRESCSMLFWMIFQKMKGMSSHTSPTTPRLDLIEPDMDMHNGVIFLGLPTEVVHKVPGKSFGLLCLLAGGENDQVFLLVCSIQYFRRTSTCFDLDVYGELSLA